MPAGDRGAAARDPAVRDRRVRAARAGTSATSSASGSRSRTCTRTAPRRWTAGSAPPGSKLEDMRIGMPFDLPPRERARRGLTLLRAGYLGEPNGKVTPDPEATAMLFDGLRRQIDTSVAPGATIQWEFTDARALAPADRQRRRLGVTGTGRARRPHLPLPVRGLDRPRRRPDRAVARARAAPDPPAAGACACWRGRPSCSRLAAAPTRARPLARRSAYRAAAALATMTAGEAPAAFSSSAAVLARTTSPGRATRIVAAKLPPTTATRLRLITRRPRRTSIVTCGLAGATVPLTRTGGPGCGRQRDRRRHHDLHHLRHRGGRVAVEHPQCRAAGERQLSAPGSVRRRRGRGQRERPAGAELLELERRAGDRRPAEDAEFPASESVAGATAAGGAP